MSLSLQTLGMLYDTDVHVKSALHLQTLGHLHEIQDAVSPTPPSPPQPVRRGGGGAGRAAYLDPRSPVYRPSPDEEVLVELSPSELVTVDEERVAARVFVEGKSQILAAELGVLLSKKKT